MKSPINFYEIRYKLNEWIIFEISQLIKNYGGYVYTFLTTEIYITLNEEFGYVSVPINRLEWDETSHTLFLFDDENKNYALTDVINKDTVLIDVYNGLYKDIERTIN